MCFAAGGVTVQDSEQHAGVFWGNPNVAVINAQPLHSVKLTHTG